MHKELELIIVSMWTIQRVFSISWTLPDYVVLGESVSIKCNVMSDEEFPKEKSKNLTKHMTWMGGDSLLCGNFKCTDSEKYRMSTVKDSPCTSELTISNLSIYDVSLQYIFFCGKKAYNTTLTASNKTIVSLPSNKTTEDDSYITNEILHVTFKLKDVNPLPECTMFYKDKTSKQLTHINAQRSGYLQNVTFLGNLPLYDLCDGRLRIICELMSKRIIVIDRLFEDSLNKDEHISCKEGKETHVIPVVAAIASISFISIAALLVVYFIRSYRRGNVYGGLPSSTRNMNPL